MDNTIFSLTAGELKPEQRGLSPLTLTTEHFLLDGYRPNKMHTNTM